MPNVVWDLAWRDRGVEKGLNRVGDAAAKAERQGKAFKTAVGVGLVVAGAAAIKFGASSVRAYSEAQTAQNRLQDAFAKFPKLADTNIGALRGLNTELAKKTRFDDDATASGQAVLAQFKLTGQQITQLTPLLQDYAAKTGKDLPTAARDLGKAMLGQGRSLKAVGINFKDSGTAGGNFSQIMTGLRTQVGGFAEKEGKTAAGQAEILKNQFGELQESVGKALLPALLKVGGGLLKVVNGFNGLSDSSKTALLSIGGGTVVLGLSALAVGKLAVGVRSARDAFKALGITAKGASIATLGIGAVVGVAALAFGAYAEKSAKAKQAVEDYTEALKQDNDQIGANVRLMAAKKLQDEGAFDLAKKLGIGVDTVTNAVLGQAAAQSRLNPLLDAYIAAGQDSADIDAIDRKNAALQLSDAVGGQNKAVTTAVAKAKEMAVAAGTAGIATAGAGVKVKTAGEKAADASKKLRDLAASMFDASKGALALSGSEISFEQAVDDATAAAKANGKTLDTNTQKGRDNKTALNNLITSSQGYISKLVETGKSSKVVTARTKDAKDEFIKVAQKMSIGRDRAVELANKYFKIPKKVTTAVTQPGMTGKGGALANVSDLTTRINHLTGKKVKINFSSNAAALSLKLGISQANILQKGAAGGPVQNLSGRGVKGKDTELFMGAVGEHMWTAKETDAVGGHQAMHGLRKAALRGELKGYVAGGPIKIQTSMPNMSVVPYAANYYAGRVGDIWGTGFGKAYISAFEKAWKAKAAAAAGGGGGPIGKGGYVRGLNWARSHRGHPYWYGTLYDCSGFVSGAHSVILGQSPHRRYTTTAFHGAHAGGLTRGKRSPFMVGVRPLSGKLGHMAATINGVNIESAGGVGVRIGSSARGWNNSMFSWRGGLAEGGPVRRGQGDLPYDLLDPRGERYNPELADLLHRAGYHRGGAIGANGAPERVLSTQQNRNWEHLTRAMDRRGGSGNTYHVTINAPGYIGDKRALADATVSVLTTLNRQGRLEGIKR
jgi:hypothetical protein